MESPSKGRDDDNDRIQPLSSADQIYSLEGQQEIPTPVSPKSSVSFGAEHSREQARIEGIISPGPVRTVQLQRHSIPGAKARLVITDVERQHNGEYSAQEAAVTDKVRLTNGGHDARSLFRKLNIWLWAVLIVATIVILAAFGFLLYLWLSRDSTWRSIAVKNWMVRATTLAASVIWLAVCSQAIISGAILFCLISSAATSVPPTRKHYVSLRKNTSGGRSWLGLAIALLLILMTTALQFASTILLADFENGLFASSSGKSNTVSYSLSDAQRSNITRTESDFSSVDPVQFPTFAQFAEPPTKQQPGIDDTGESIRAFLPIASSVDRTSLAAYRGWATLVNSRVICLAPSIENVTYSSSGPSTSPALPTQQIQGSVSIGNSLPDGLMAESSANALEFACDFELAQAKAEWPITMCAIRRQTAALNITSPFADGIMGDKLGVVLLNHTANKTIPVSASVDSGDPGNATVGLQNVTIGSWDESQIGVWTNLTYGPNPIFSMQLTLCFASFGSLDAEIEASGVRNRSEPVVQMNDAGSIFDLNVNEVLLQLGVSDGTVDQDVLTLKEQRPWGTSQNPSSALESRSTFRMNDATYGLCTFCGGYDDDSTARGITSTLSIVFQRGLQESGSPAKALQALFTLTSSTQYYSRLPYFDLTASATVDDFQQAYHPHHRAGLITIGSLLVAHLVLVTLIIVLSLLRSEESLVDQFWRHTAAHLDRSTSEVTSGESILG